MRVKHPEAIRKVALAREKRYLDGLVATSDTWLPLVQRLRPQHSWDDVVHALNDRGQSWTGERLRRAVGKLVAQRMASPALLQAAPRRSAQDRLVSLVASIAMADPSLTLREIAAQLERMRERTPRGGRSWSASSVKGQLDRARKLGLAVPSETK